MHKFFMCYAIGSNICLLWSHVNWRLSLISCKIFVFVLVFKQKINLDDHDKIKLNSFNINIIISWVVQQEYSIIEQHNNGVINLLLW